MVFDLRELKQILSEEVVEPMDHRFRIARFRPSIGSCRPPRTSPSRFGNVWSRGRTAEYPFEECGLYETADLFADYGGDA